ETPRGRRRGEGRREGTECIGWGEGRDPRRGEALESYPAQPRFAGCVRTQSCDSMAAPSRGGHFYELRCRGGSGSSVAVAGVAGGLREGGCGGPGNRRVCRRSRRCRAWILPGCSG